MNINDKINRMEKDLAALKAAINSNQIDVTVILDESGSMQGHKEGTIEGFNAYVSKLREDSEHDYRLTLTKFDSFGRRTIFEQAELNKVQLDSSNYNPNGGTPLYDAIGEGIERTQRQHRSSAKVFFVVITDGYENESKRFSRNSISSLITTKTNKENWEFVYLGANQDAWSVGGGMGFANNITYDMANINQTFSGMGSGTVAYAASSTAGLSRSASRRVMARALNAEDSSAKVQIGEEDEEEEAPTLTSTNV